MSYNLMSDSEKCFSYHQEAKSYCTYKSLNINLCTKDREDHEALPGDPTIKLNKATNMLKPNPTFKGNLIDEIIKIKFSAEIQTKRVLNVSAEVIRLIQKETKETLAKLNRFVILCNDVLSQIYSIDSICPKEIYSPIEALLLFEDSEKIIKKIKAPTIEIAEVPVVFSYISTTFPHFLYSFSEMSISYPIENGAIQVANPEKTIKNGRLNMYQRCLSLQNKKVLITGGHVQNYEVTEAFIIDVVSGKIIEVPRLIYPRRSHSMAWINGAPSAIGGFNQGKSIKNVEIFMNNQWVEIQPLNVPRALATSITLINTVWTIGGINEEYLNSIEKYKENEWILLSICLPFPCAAIGLVSIEDSCLLFGGSLKNNKFSKNLLIASKNWTSIEEIGCLTNAMHFSFNQFSIEADKISIIGKSESSRTFKENIKVSSLRF